MKDDIQALSHEPCDGVFAFGNKWKWNEMSMNNNILCRQYKMLNNKERRTTVKKVVAASFFTMLSIPTMTVDPIVKTIVKVLTFHMGI